MNFAYPLWLFALLVIPVFWAFFFFFYEKKGTKHQLETFIDAHLLPYLLVGFSGKKGFSRKSLLLWSTVWLFLTFALAGPRWNFREIEMFSKDQSLVVLLDLSDSMNATDIKPSRLGKAKQKIEDLIELSKGVKMGLIAFAADPHMIAPLTEDKEMIRHLLPALGTDLVYIQGSRLSSALEMASCMLESEPGNNKAILVVSDGGFEDGPALSSAKSLSEKGVLIHVMGIGSTEGAVLKDQQGNVVKKNATPILSKLEKQKLKELSEVGKGYYLEAHYSNSNEVLILNELEHRASAEEKIGKKNKLWDERFYFFLIPILPVILFWFRKGAFFCFMIPLFLSPLEAKQVSDLFKNSEELGKESFDVGNYEDAIKNFKDPYRKGVAYYKAGHLEEAEKMFFESLKKGDSLKALYNLGNSLALQKKFKEAVATYEKVLEKWPDHAKAKDNLEIVKSMMKEEESKKSDSGEKKKSDSKQDPSQSKEENKEDQKEPSPEEKKNEKVPEEEPKKDKEEDQSPEEESKQELEESEKSPEEESPDEERKPFKSEEDLNADMWLNRISNDPKPFLKNKFYIESKKSGTTKGVDPW